MLPTLSRLLVATTLLAAPGAAMADQHFQTRDFLDLPEIFQVSVVVGSMAMLHHLPEACEACACFARWTVPEDVVVIVSNYTRTRPESLGATFASTLVTALEERCERLG